MVNTHVVLPGRQHPDKRAAHHVRDVDRPTPASVRDVNRTTQVSVRVTARGPAVPDAAEPTTAAELEQRNGDEQEDVAQVAAAPKKDELKGRGSVAAVAEPARQWDSRPSEGGVSCGTRDRSAEQGDFRGRQGKLLIPSEVEWLATGVFGLDQRTVAQRKAVASAIEHSAVVGHGSKRSLTPSDPSCKLRFLACRASGQTIAICGVRWRISSGRSDGPLRGADQPAETTA
jgi:kumamolisin